MNNGTLIVISGPSGSGKDTILSKVLEKLGENAFLSVSMTTRKMRPGEAEGVNYYFVSEDEFRKNIENNQMLEYAQYGSNYYGTPIGPIKKLLDEGKTVFLNIEVQGGANVRRLLPFATEIFVVPPSLEILEKRLTERGTDSPEDIAKRMSIARDELLCAKDYDFIVINDDLDDAVGDVMAIIRSSELKKDKMINYISEVNLNA